MIKISSDKTLWENKILDEGLVYVIIPGLRRFVGPLSLNDFIAHKNKEKMNKELSILEQEMSNIAKIPPFTI
jgi:hypothetical protein